LGEVLLSRGKLAEAAFVYEQAAATRNDAAPSPADLLLQMELGRIYLLDDKPRKAAECFARVIRGVELPQKLVEPKQLRRMLFSDEPAAYQMMGDSFLRADRPADAEAAFAKVEELSPQPARRQFNRARLLLKTDRPAEALAAIEAAFAERLTAEDAAPYEILAEILDKLGRKEELLPRLEKMLAAEPDNVHLGGFLAAKCLAADKLEQAESLYRKLLKAKPTTAAWRGLVETLVKAKRTDAVLAALGECIEEFGALETLSDVLPAVPTDAGYAKELAAAARKKLESEPKSLGRGERLAVAVVVQEAKLPDLAAEFFKLALEIKSDRAGEALLIWGLGLMARNRYAEAADVFRRAIDEKALPADNPTFHFYLSGAAALAERPDEALAAARAAAEIAPASPRCLARPAWTLYFAKRHDEARKEYEELLQKFDAERDSAETREVLREARLALSNIAVERGDMPAAEEYLEQVLDEFPDDIGAMNDLGYLWADQNKRLRQAGRMIALAVAAEPDNAAYRDSLGWWLYRRGKYPQAAAELEKAAADKPDGTVFEHLGEAYQKLGDLDRAQIAWRRAAETYRKEKENDKARVVEKKLPKQ
jgi:tetratricopeptide (TPR) repeat protein